MTNGNEIRGEPGRPGADAAAPAGRGSVGAILRIGVVTEPIGDQHALRFLILKLNGLQHSFEFELVTPPTDDPLLDDLRGLQIDRERIKKGLVDLAGRLKRAILDDNVLGIPAIIFTK